jgi:opine dehydrogenase
MEEAVFQADVILVVVPAFAHGPLFDRLLPLLRDGHKIVLIPGNYGSLLLRKMMREGGVTASVSISETASLPYACRATSYNTVMIHKAKKAVKVATYPTEAASEIRDVLNAITEIFIPGENVLEVSLDNFNCIMHPLPFLLNVGSIEKNPETFRHYVDGVTPLVSEKMAEMDQERLAIGRAYSLHLMSSLDPLMMYYGENRSRSILEYVNSSQSPYKGIIGHGLYSRYITEDVPYLVVPAMLLGEKGGVKSSWFELCAHLASMLHAKDYVAAGHNLGNLGIAQLDKNGILDYVS